MNSPSRSLFVYYVKIRKFNCFIICYLSVNFFVFNWLYRTLNKSSRRIFSSINETERKEPLLFSDAMSFYCQNKMPIPLNYLQPNRTTYPFHAKLATSTSFPVNNCKMKQSPISKTTSSSATSIHRASEHKRNSKCQFWISLFSLEVLWYDLPIAASVFPAVSLDVSRCHSKHLVHIHERLMKRRHVWLRINLLQTNTPRSHIKGNLPKTGPDQWVSNSATNNWHTRGSHGPTPCPHPYLLPPLPLLKLATTMMSTWIIGCEKRAMTKRRTAQLLHRI